MGGSIWRATEPPIIFFISESIDKREGLRAVAFMALVQFSEPPRLLVCTSIFMP
jgi:hypothetical protein